MPNLRPSHLVQLVGFLMSQANPNINRRLTTIDDLPVELIISVLSCFRPPTSHKKENHGRCWSEELQFPIRLLGVCRRWREILRQMSFMWTKVYIQMPEIGDAIYIDKILERLQWQLSLTANSPLHITWSARGEIANSSLVKMYQLIISHAPINRWRSLHYAYAKSFPGMNEASLAPNGEGFDLLEFLDIGGTPMERHFVDLIDRTALKLQKLDLKFHDGGPENEEGFQEVYHELTPGIQTRITSLQYDDFIAFENLHGFKNVTHFMGRSSGLFPSFPKLTHLTITYGFFDDLYEFRMALANLVFLEVYLFPSQMSSLRIVPLPSLLHLNIIWEDRGVDAPVGWIRAPRLEHLELRCPETVFYIWMGRSIEELFNMPYDDRYQLDPRIVTLELPLTPHVLGNFLHHSLAVQRLTITLERHDSIYHQIIADMFTQTKMTDLAIMHTGWEYCQRLVSLRIYLLWSRDDTDLWVVCARRIVEARGRDISGGVRVMWADSGVIEILPEM